MAVWSKVYFSKLSGNLRLDAEHYKPNLLRYLEILKDSECLESQECKILHPTEIKRVYQEHGLRILLAQNVKRNYLDLTHQAYMANKFAHELRRNRLISGDILMVRTGANFGDTALFREEGEPIYACADCLIIRTKTIPPGYLATFLNTEIGRSLILRGSYGGAQPHIAPNYLYTLRIPRLGKFEDKIHSMLYAAYDTQLEAERLFSEAETILADELGLGELDLSDELTYVRRFKETEDAGRIDAEHFKSKYARIVQRLKQYKGGFSTIGEIMQSVTNGVECRTFEDEGTPYIRVGDMRRLKISSATAQKIDSGIAAKLRKKIALKEGDILTSRSGSIGQSAVITKEDHDSILSSHLIRLRPKKKLGFQSTFLALFLASVAGVEQILKHSNGGIVPEIAQPGLKRIVVPLPPSAIQEKIAETIRASQKAEDESKRLLEDAKRIVEEMVMGE